MGGGALLKKYILRRVLKEEVDLGKMYVAKGGM